MTVTVSKFDTIEPYHTIRDATPLGDWQPLIRRDYNPRGGTPLRDATAKFIAHLDAQAGRDDHGNYAKGKVTIGLMADESGSMGGNEESVVAGINEFVGGMADVEVDPETDGKVLAVILTDGHENSSKEVSADALRQMVDAREKEGWTFIYLGANQDAWAVGNTSGITGQSASLYNYSGTAEGTTAAFSAVTADAGQWLGDNRQRAATKASMGGTTMSSISPEGAVAGGQGMSPELKEAMEKRAKEQAKKQNEAPTSGSSYDIKDALAKAKGESDDLS